MFSIKSIICLVIIYLNSSLFIHITYAKTIGQPYNYNQIPIKSDLINKNHTIKSTKPITHVFQNMFKPIATTSSATDLLTISAKELSIGESRRKKKGYKKARKWIRYIFPIMIGLFTAKSVIVPLLLKALTLLSTSSFLLSSLSFMISSLIGIKWMVTTMSAGNNSKQRVEVVHVPIKKYHGWSDRDNKFIPITYDDYNMNFDEKTQPPSPPFV